MGRLPEVETREWLLDTLSALLLRQGEPTFVVGPLRFPTVSDFPDHWEGDLASLERLCQRILGYCGLDGYRVVLERFADEAVVDRVNAQGEAQFRHEGAAAWFAGVRGQTIHFGCSERQLDEAGEALIGVMAHEVAHAYRAVHGLVVEDSELEERLTDLTTVYLGFGVFTVNNTHRYRTFGGMQGAAAVSGYSMSRAGYLSAEAMSFLLAAQILCRGLGCWETTRLLQWLEPNQRGHVKASLRALRPAEKLWSRLRPELPSHSF